MVMSAIIIAVILNQTIHINKTNAIIISILFVLQD